MCTSPAHRRSPDSFLLGSIVLKQTSRRAQLHYEASHPDWSTPLWFPLARSSLKFDPCVASSQYVGTFRHACEFARTLFGGSPVSEKTTLLGSPVDKGNGALPLTP